RKNNIWSQMAKLVGTDNIGAAAQGWSVAISKNAKTIASGGISDNGTRGAVWIFTRKTDIWLQDAKLFGLNGEVLSSQGWSVSLSGNGMTLAEGGPGINASPDVGAVWIFKKNPISGAWNEGEKLVSLEDNIFLQGISVSLDCLGELLAVGAPGEASGFVLIYEQCKNKWRRFGNPIKGPLDSGFGESVSLSSGGKLLAVGAPFDNNNFGATYIYIKNECKYLQLQTVTGSAAGNPFQGRSISLSANAATLAVGGEGDINNSGGTTQGKTWIFEIETQEC
ncbi:MAG: hypothetical protein Harvfovirus3_81, partial [Harvfovirus sp.]